MKKITALLIYSLFTTISLRADVLFSDNLNYPDGCIETDGLWYAYAPASPHQDAFVTNDFLILNQANSDSVAAPSSNFTIASSIVFASFTINVSSLPTLKGGYFCSFKSSTNVYIANVFIATTNTIVPGTYQLGIANAATSVSAAGVAFFPLDLATDITYQVVFSYDVNSSDPLAGATLWVNPASVSDVNVYPIDLVTNAAQSSIVISQIAFSQYFNQGVAAIGNILVGTTFGDVVTNTPQAPVIGIQPQDTNVYSGDNVTLYVAASGTGQLTYQWLSNSIPLSDDGVTVSGSLSNIVTLSSLQNSAGYSVVVANSSGSVTSRVAMVAVDSTPTPPFFTSLPQSVTNSLGFTITLTAVANGTPPLSYQWYFEPTNTASFTLLSGQTNTTLSLTNAQFMQSGFYYVAVTGGAGNTNSPTNSVLVTPPINVTIAYLHSLMTTNQSGSYDIGAGAYVNIQGVVTSFAPLSGTNSVAGEYYIQDGTSGIFVYIGNQGSNSVPPAGAWVSVTGPCQVYNGQLEIDPNLNGNAVTNNVSVLSYNNPLPASQSIDFALMATNSLGAYGIQIQNSLVTVTNVYIYSSKTGGSVSGNFATNEATKLYMTTQPYAVGAKYLTLYVYAVNGEATNFWGQLIPGQAYEITGIMGQFDSTPELYPTRYVDIVTNLPAPFAVSIAQTNGVSQLSWPTVTGSTYSVYRATNITGPWNRTFGLGYFPSSGIYTQTNPPDTQFYKVSSP